MEVVQEEMVHLAEEAFEDLPDEEQATGGG